MADAPTEGEIRQLLEGIFYQYHYDFRDYALASLKRRLTLAVERLGVQGLGELQTRLIHEPTLFWKLLQYLTVPLSDMFRDPLYFATLRSQVIPVLRTYPSLKVWVAGCSTGEEVYSLAILLREEALLDRTLIYATDINPDCLKRAEAGIYELDRFQQFTENHRLSGGRGSLSVHYQAAHGAAILDKSLRKNVVFSDHSLTTDSVFAEVHLVSCRNVLIYFTRELQNRVIGLFRDSVCRRGFLGLGLKESLKFTPNGQAFSELSPEARIYQKRS